VTEARSPLEPGWEAQARQVMRRRQRFVLPLLVAVGVGTAVALALAEKSSLGLTLFVVGSVLVALAIASVVARRRVAKLQPSPLLALAPGRRRAVVRLLRRGLPAQDRETAVLLDEVGRRHLEGKVSQYPRRTWILLALIVLLRIPDLFTKPVGSLRWWLVVVLIPTVVACVVYLTYERHRMKVSLEKNAQRWNLSPP
jgi:hypothetical protein